MEDTIDLKKIYTQTIDAEWLDKKNTKFDVLRLDKMHEIISGNKWFKLKYYLQDAAVKGFDVLATFGGAYSNHIIAMACVCKLQGLKSIGIIRGERPKILSHTLLLAEQYGMELHFVSRSQYKNAETLKQGFKNVYWVNEGGYGINGMRGAKEILQFRIGQKQYSHIICAVGTGTMMAGIIEAVTHNQFVIGISVMKGNDALLNNITALVGEEQHKKKYIVVNGYHFGGYAKHPPELIQFMNDTYIQHQLPTDIVYTSKTFYAVQQMIANNMIAAGSSVLMIHSGGLQGNLSLPLNSLCF